MTTTLQLPLTPTTITPSLSIDFTWKSFESLNTGNPNFNGCYYFSQSQHGRLGRARRFLSRRTVSLSYPTADFYKAPPLFLDGMSWHLHATK